MFAWLAARLVGLGWRRSRRLCLAWPAPQAALAGGLLLATAYALFSGWGVPAQRTLLMLALVAALRAAGRHWPWPVVWLAACAAVVAADPWALLQPGFWLSFVAVGVLFATDPVRPAAATAPALGWRARLAGLLREQLLLTVALAPLTLLLFGQVALAGLLANLLAIPWVTLVVTPLALAGAAWPPVWDLAALAVQALVAGLEPLAALPLAVWTRPAPPLWAGVAGVAGGLLLVLPAAPVLRALGLPLLLPVLLWQAPRPPPGAYELLAADVGQGSAVLVRTAGHTLVYDAGPRWSGDSDAGQRVLVPLLRALGERVDTLVLSHADTDHTGGAAAVLAQQPQAGLLHGLEPGHPLLAGRTALPCGAGQRWAWDGVEFQVLHPAQSDLPAGASTNARSCVLRVSDGRQAALLAGDIELPQEAALLARGAPLQAQVLLVAHHGSRTSSGPAFVDAVRPRWALVQAGRANRYGHPAPAVVARWEAAGAALVRSDRCGAAWWSSAAPQAIRCEREAVRRYWHLRTAPSDS
jgi:competence protein ComEC